MKGLGIEVRNEIINTIAKKVRARLDKDVNDIFLDAEKELEIASGDITPGYSIAIDSLTDDLTKSISEALYYMMK